MARPSKSELARLNAEMEFWESLMPPGFTLYGWTYQKTATLFTPTGRTWEVNAELLHQIREAFGVSL
jgi:hypothetical protein